MMRQVSSRNQRSKGLRVKNVLRWYLLAAACLWLLYQLKHSYDKKRAPEERNLEASEKIVESQPEVFKFSRKDLPRSEENGSGNDTHDKEEDNQEVEGEEEDQEIKQAMEDEEDGGDGDDEINEQDQERTDEQEDQERADEEAENGEELTNEEDKDGQGEETEQLDDQDTEEDSFNEAREESYKRDDASGVILQENQVKNSKDEDGYAGEEVMEYTQEKVDLDDMADGADDASKADSDLSFGAADVSKDNVTGVVFAGNETNHNYHRTKNGTVIEKKGSEFGLNISEWSLTSNQIELHSNSTTAPVINYHIEAQANSTSSVSNIQIETQTNSAVFDAVAGNVPLQNETVGRVSVQNHNITIEMENSEQDSISFKNVVMEGLVERSNRTVGQEDAGEHSFVSLGAIDKRDAIHGELAESSHKMVIEEERDARTDLSTLPAMQNEVKVMVGEAAE